MKASEAQARTALDRAAPDIRLYLFHGPDEAGAMALAKRLEAALGADAERIDLDAATLKSDPARLADEAAALSLFGGARWIRALGVGEESLAAATGLLEADRAGNPVVLVAPNVKTSGNLVKLAIAAPAAMAVACYVPEGRKAEEIAVDLARDQGLRIAGGAARRLALASGGDRAVIAREVEKLALYLDAAPDRPQTADDEALEAIGADLGESEMGRAVAAVVAGDAAALGAELARLREAGTHPVPWLRAMARRLSSLAEMRGEVDGGESIDTVIKRHRVHFREETATKAALARWSTTALAQAHDRTRRAERAVMAPGNPGTVRAEHDALLLAGSGGRRGPGRNPSERGRATNI